MIFSLEKAAEIIQRSKSVIALTGAGISVESGIPDFRSEGGLWEKYDPKIYATIESFKARPEMVWEMLFEMISLVRSTLPNSAHYALVQLEHMGLLKGIITQNIDSLHSKAGSSTVIEYHGNTERLDCLGCGKSYKSEIYDLGKMEIPRCISCDSVLKPSVIFFGEMIPQRALEESQRMAESADMVIVVGTSSVVYPAAGIPLLAKHNGATVVEVNVEPTSLTSGVTDIFLEGKAGRVLPEILKNFRYS